MTETRTMDEQFMEELRIIEKEKRMPYVTSVERIGIEKGIRMGSLKEAQEMVIEALKARFGTVPQDVQKTVQKIEVKENLKRLLRQAILSDSLEAFQRQLQL